MIHRIYGIATILVAILALSVPAHAQQPLVDKFVLNDSIQPITRGELDRAIQRANSDGASALLIEMDTPGGLLDSMRPWLAQFSPRGFRSLFM